jgi:serine/threonine protein kinase
VVNESRILSKLKSRFVVNRRAAFQDKDNLYFVLDYFKGGDLRFHICVEKSFTER